MALAVPKQKRQFPWILVLVLLSFLGLVGTASWYGYRWYAYGESLPVDIPALASSSSPKPDGTEIGAMQIASHSVAPSEPRYLKISKLGIEKARVFSADLDSTGFVKSPLNKQDVSWFNESAAPGVGGVTLFSGHGAKDAEGSIFSKLDSISTDAVIEIELGSGDVVRYQVKEILNPTLEELQENQSLLTDSAVPGKDGLNLTTRDGVWVPRLDQYSHRIIVRAVLAE